MGITFDIRSPSDYYKNLLLDQYNEFLTEANYNSVRHAIICSILAYHLREWIWNCNKDAVKDYLLSQKFISRSKIDNDDYIECKFNEYVNRKCPDFRMIREICNGSKHFSTRERGTVKDTYKREGGPSGAFNGNAFQTDDLIIKDNNDNEIVFKFLLIRVVDYLNNLICSLKI
jgi:hypothetical protein